jgi:hypothetical protein
MPGSGQDVPYFVLAPPVREWARPKSAIFECAHFFQNRTQIDKQAMSAPAQFGSAISLAVVDWQAADVPFGNAFVASNKDYLFVRNTHVSLSRTVTIRSVAETGFGRTGDIVLAIPASTTLMFGPIAKAGWMQADGSVYVDAQTSEVHLVAVTFA